MFQSQQHTATAENLIKKMGSKQFHLILAHISKTSNDNHRTTRRRRKKNVRNDENDYP